MRVLCDGIGKRGVAKDNGYPSCPDCGREFSAQGRKASARLGNPWTAIPRHYAEMESEFIHPIDRRDPNWLSAAEESRQEINEHLERKSRQVDGPPPAPRCPHCGLVMSNREAAEQGACNECSGGAYDPRGYGSDEMEGGY